MSCSAAACAFLWLMFGVGGREGIFVSACFDCLPVCLRVFVCVCVCPCMCVYLGGLGILPPTLVSQTARVPNSYRLAPVLKLPYLCVRERERERETYSFSAAVAGHNLTSLFELGLSEWEWKRAVKEMTTTNSMLIFSQTSFYYEMLGD